MGTNLKSLVILICDSSPFSKSYDPLASFPGPFEKSEEYFLNGPGNKANEPCDHLAIQSLSMSDCHNH